MKKRYVFNVYFDPPKDDLFGGIGQAWNTRFFDVDPVGFSDDEVAVAAIENLKTCGQFPNAEVTFLGTEEIVLDSSTL